MTYLELLMLLQSMKDANHSCMDEEVCFIDGTEKYYVDLVESLVSGEVYFTYGEGKAENEDT
jgi:hypothetical protein